MTPLISPSALAEALNGPRPPVLLDARWRWDGTSGRSDYLTGHLPGAIHVDLEADLAGPVEEGSGRHPLPDLDAFGSVMRAAGVSHGRSVVVYDEGRGWAAARAWWLLRWAGHQRVRVLDGGLAVWNGALDRAVPQPTPGDFRPVAGAVPVLTADDAAALARRGVLLDARAAERYRGEVEPVDPVAGHIPGAVSAPTSENVTEASSFRSVCELTDRFAALGVTADTEVGVYCGSGVSAAHQVLALASMGVDAALYVGSWSAWTSDPSRSVATGPEPG